MDTWAKDWDNPQDAVYDKIRSSVVSAREKFEAPIRADERERIIKLLEANHYKNTWEHYPTKWVYMENCMACNAIALIKGEK
jgi:hypothetical protein